MQWQKLETTIVVALNLKEFTRMLSTYTLDLVFLNVYIVNKDICLLYIVCTNETIITSFLQYMNLHWILFLLP